jgi:hypothetical protein
MAFEFRIPADRVSDSMFPGARHLNRMDKITLHVIQMDSNPQSLNFRVLDTRASNLEVSYSKVSKASDTWVSEVLDMSLGGPKSVSLVSDPSVLDPRPGLGGRGLRRSWALTFLGLDLGQ